MVQNNLKPIHINFNDYENDIWLESVIFKEDKSFLFRFPINDWSIKGYMEYKSGKEWAIRELILWKIIETENGIIELIHNVADFKDPNDFSEALKNSLIKLFELVKNHETHAIKDVLNSLRSFSPKVENYSSVTYWSKDEKVFVDVDNSWCKWRFRIKYIDEEGDDLEILNTLEKLILEIERDGSDRKLIDYCLKLAKTLR